VINDEGRFILPELTSASYTVRVRGYGLADSDPVAGRPGDEHTLTARLPPTPQAAKPVYRANYWYSLVEVPERGEFPGTGAEGVERNLVLTMWDWWTPYSYVHDQVTTDKGNPNVNAHGPLYGVSMSDDQLLIVDPNTHETGDQAPVDWTGVVTVSMPDGRGEPSGQTSGRIVPGTSKGDRAHSARS